jgi:hypothetical protein
LIGKPTSLFTVSGTRGAKRAKESEEEESVDQERYDGQGCQQQQSSRVQGVENEPDENRGTASVTRKEADQDKDSNHHHIDDHRRRWRASLSYEGIEYARGTQAEGHGDTANPVSERTLFSTDNPATVKNKRLAIAPGGTAVARAPAPPDCEGGR